MNEITLPVSELKTALPGLNKIVGRRTSLPVLQNVKVSRKQNGLVTLQATDLDAFATYTLTSTQSGPAIEVLMPLEQLNKAFKCSGPKDEVALICEGREAKLCYTIAGSPVYQPVTLTNVNEWPPSPEIKSNSFKLDPEFGPALKQALENCSDDPSRYVLRGACLDVTDAKCHYVVGTNGRALFSANSFTFPLKKSVIIPDSKFLAEGDFLEAEPCYLSVQPGKGKHSTSQVCLHNTRWQFITREIDGKYPNWKQVVPITNGRWTQVKLNPPAVSQLLQVIPRLPGDDGINCPVRLRIEKCLWIEGRNKDDKEWTKVAVPDVSVTGKGGTLPFRLHYLPTNDATS
jgi:DNA polymerase III sliding clamp (beta) subunit (PCNA family)